MVTQQKNFNDATSPGLFWACVLILKDGLLEVVPSRHVVRGSKKKTTSMEMLRVRSLIEECYTVAFDTLRRLSKSVLTRDDDN